MTLNVTVDLSKYHDVNVSYYKHFVVFNHRVLIHNSD